LATYSQTVNRYADRLIDGVRQVDDMAVSAASAVSKKIGNVLPAELPGADYIRQMPRPEEWVKTYFDFVERLVKTQRTYSLDLVKAFEPITRRVWKPANVRKAA
jgi:hypothetical protein